MTALPETIGRRWASVLPMMQAGALLARSAADGRFYVDGHWGGLDDEDMRALSARGVVRAIGDAYLINQGAPADPAPIETVFPAITIWQPWATLIAEDAKPWEFRGRRCPSAYVGRRIAIHAGARPLQVREVKMLLLRLQTGRASQTGLIKDRAIPVLEAMLRAPAAVTLRAVLCTAVLGEPVRDHALAAQLGAAEVLDSDRNEHTSWGWPLSSVERLVLPVPATGKQGWWQWRAGEP